MSSGEPSPRYGDDHPDGEAAGRASVFIACPLCRDPIPLARGDLPEQILCVACGAILHR